MAQRTGEISRRWAAALFEAFDLAHTPDRLTELAFHLPVYIVASLLGIADDDLPQTAAWVGDFVRGIAPLASAEQIVQGAQAAQHLKRLLAQHADQTMLALLMQEAAQVEQHDTEVLTTNAIGLLMQSYDATAGLIGSALIALAEHSSIAAHITEHPHLVRPLLYEVLRYDSPVQNTRRFVTQDGIVGGCDMKAGDAILVLLAAANRDPSTNRNADQFDIFRKDSRLFTFGIGTHACPGEHMAVTIAQAALELFMTIQTPMALSRESITYRPSVNSRIPVFALQTVLIR
jgi:cytochrome P450